MKVIHYISSFSIPSETFIKDLINNLEDKGVDNYILTQELVGDYDNQIDKIVLIKRENNLIRRFSKMFFLNNNGKLSKVVYKHIENIKPDIIHAHFGPNGVEIYKIITEKKINIKLFISFHGMDINVLPNKDSRYKGMLNKIDKDDNVFFISPSIFLKRKMIQVGLSKEKIFILPNAVNKRFVNNFYPRKLEHGQTLKILSVGRFEEVKGYKYLIECIHKLREIYENIELTLVGYGTLEKDLKYLVNEYNLNRNIKFITQAPHEKIPNIMREHTLYIQPSIVASDGAEENLSVATIEAQVSGLPAIVSDIGGFKEIVTDNSTGCLFEQKSVNAMLKAILYYLQHPNFIEVHSIEAHFISRNKFDSEKIVRNLMDIYEDISKK